MNLFVILLITAGALLFMPLMAGLIVWWNSFRLPIYLFKEIGKDENDSVIKQHWAKVKYNKILGGLVHFRPFQGPGLKDAKRYNNTLWSRVSMKKNRSREGLLLYAQGTNYRPMKVREEQNGSITLVVVNEDTREFIIDREMSAGLMNEESRTVLYTVLLFSAAVVIITVFSLLSYLYLGNSDIEQYIRAVQAGPIIGGFNG